MSWGKIMASGIVLSGVFAGAALYYLQVYAFYEAVPATADDDVQLTRFGSDTPEGIIYDDFEAIDSDSSPIRYRACFTTPMSHAMLSETYAPYPRPIPRVGPGWFECFDAEAVAAELDAGTALAFMGEKNIRYGVDRVVAITEDGRGYVWHELNDCTDPLASDEAKARDCPSEE